MIHKLFNNIAKIIANVDPIRILVVGYISYMLIGWILLSLPFSQTQPVTILDNLFTSVSAVSTTGLVSIDPGSNYTLFGEIIILCLIQLGGLGYMTLGSFIILQTSDNLSAVREEMTRTAFPLPKNIDIVLFLKSVVIFTFITELIGSFLLYIYFLSQGIEQPLWSAIFHSVSAFCTAGFSLNSDSFIQFSDHTGIQVVLSILSLFGAIGFIVVTDVYKKIVRSEKLSFTSIVIIKITLFFLIAGSLAFYFLEPAIVKLDFQERWLAAFFQSMTATTTVGFNTVDLGSFITPSLMFLFFLMLFGASPSGTGGGLKSTTFAALIGLVKSTLRRDKWVTYMNRKVPLERLRFAVTSFVFTGFVLGLSILGLSLTESFSFEKIVFEAFSALGTVGLSTGITGNLSVFGKLIVIILMIMGRVGVLSFGLAISKTSFENVVEGQHDLVI